MLLNSSSTHALHLGGRGDSVDDGAGAGAAVNAFVIIDVLLANVDTLSGVTVFFGNSTDSIASQSIASF